MPRSWLVGKQLSLSALRSFHTYALGGVELRAQDSLTRDEFAALDESARSQGMSLEHFKHSPVACVIVLAEDVLTATEIADGPIAEVLDFQEAFEIGGQFSRNEILPASFVRDMETGAVSVGRTLLSSKLWGTPVRMRNWFWEPPDAMRRAFFLERSELGVQLRRSVHWWRRSRSVLDGQLRLLWRWFAIEALCKVRVEETDITPRIRWFLGFPTGPALTTVPRRLIAEWEAQADYDTWRRKVVRWLVEIRDFRNESVHNGFRFADIDVGRLRLYNRVADTVCVNLHQATHRALAIGARSRQDLADYVDCVFREWDPRTFFERTISMINDLSEI